MDAVRTSSTSNAAAKPEKEHNNTNHEIIVHPSESLCSPLKKGDSGICIKKSHDEDSSSDECSKEQIESTNGEVNSPDSGHQDSSFSLSQSVSAEELKLNETKRNDISQPINETIIKDEDTSSSVEETEGNNSIELEESSSNEIVDLDDRMSWKSDDKITVNEKDGDKTYKPITNTPKPAYKWFPCQEIINRQYGTSNRHVSDLFRLRAYGSLHSVEHLQLLHTLNYHEGCVNALHFNSTGTKLASGSDDLNIIVWDWLKAKPILVYNSGHRNNVFQAKFLPLSGDCHIVSCGRDGLVRIAELSTTGICKNTRRLAEHVGAAHKLALEMESPHSFMSCGEDGVVFEIDLREEKPIRVLQCTENEKHMSLFSIAVNPSRSYEFAVGGRDHFVRLYDKRYVHLEGKPMKKFCPKHLVDSKIRADVTCVMYNYNGNELLASYNDDDIYSYDVQCSDDQQYLHRYRGHRNNQTVKSVNYFGPKSEYVVSGSDCSYIYFWERKSGSIVQCVHGDEAGVVNFLEPHPNSPVLATSGLDADIKIWMPSSENIPDSSKLNTQINSNLKEREEDRNRGGHDAIDGQMLWFFVQHLHRTAQRRARMEEQDDSNSNSNDTESEDDEFDVPHSLQCTQS